MKRKHISWKTRCASATLAFMDATDRRGPCYADAKLMTEDQFLSLFHWDHNILHSSGHLDADKFWNLAPMLIRAHREKTKTDAAIIAKSRRIRLRPYKKVGKGPWPFTEVGVVITKPKHKLRSRGFDKTRKRKIDGTVVKRKG